MQVDEDADDLSFPAMISQLFEFILCIVSNSVFLPLLQPVLPELAYLTIGALPPPPPPCKLPSLPAPQPHIHSKVSSAATAGVAAACTCFWRCAEVGCP